MAFANTIDDGQYATLDHPTFSDRLYSEIGTWAITVSISGVSLRLWGAICYTYMGSMLHFHLPLLRSRHVSFVLEYIRQPCLTYTIRDLLQKGLLSFPGTEIISVISIQIHVQGRAKSNRKRLILVVACTPRVSHQKMHTLTPPFVFCSRVSALPLGSLGIVESDRSSEHPPSIQISPNPAVMIEKTEPKEDWDRSKKKKIQWKCEFLEGSNTAKCFCFGRREQVGS